MNNVKVRITAPLRKFTDGLDEISTRAESVGDALAGLCAQYPALDGRILGSDGKPPEFINVFVGKKNIRALDGARTRVGDGDVISISSPFSGG